MMPESFVELLGREKATAIVRWSDQENAGQAMEAAVSGGFRVVEFTLTTPGAFELIQDFSRREDLVVGAGTVMSPELARKAVDAGARFLVSPVVDREVIRTAHELAVAVMPGTHTPTEMMAAHSEGAQLLKLFPVPGAGPYYVHACLGPLPFLRIVPTNGVDEENVLEWLKAGAYAVGFASHLFDPGDVENGRWDAIEARAERILRKVRKGI
jgi:Entner-Doudoroff aldolase